MAETAKGYPFPDTVDPADIPADIEALAAVCDDRPGVSALTTTMRNDLAGSELWDGRVIWNVTTGRLETFDASGPAWVLAAPRSHNDLADLTTGNPHTQYAKLAGDTFTGQVNADANLRVGAGGTPYKDRRRLAPVFNPPNLASGTGASWDIPLGVVLPGAVGDWTVTFHSGLQNGVATPTDGGAVLQTLSEVRLFVRNSTAVDINLDAREFVFTLERI